MEGAPFVPSVKHVLGRRGVPVGSDVRAPLQALTAEQASRLDAALDNLGL